MICEQGGEQVGGLGVDGWPTTQHVARPSPPQKVRRWRGWFSTQHPGLEAHPAATHRREVAAEEVGVIAAGPQEAPSQDEHVQGAQHVRGVHAVVVGVVGVPASRAGWGE